MRVALADISRYRDSGWATRRDKAAFGFRQSSAPSPGHAKADRPQRLLGRFPVLLCVATGQADAANDETTDLTVEQVAGAAGFGSATLLRKHLHAAVGLSPGSYRRSFVAPGCVDLPIS
jgi:AraC-like DNA-binding protein